MIHPSLRDCSKTSNSSFSSLGSMTNTSSKAVHFGNVEIREYPMILGNNPSAGIGAPVELDWEYSEGKFVSISEEEEEGNNNNKRRHKNKSPREFYLNYYQRIKIAESAGFSKKEFDKAEKQVQWSQAKRKISSFQSFPLLWIKSWKVQFAMYKNKKFLNKYRKEHSIGHGTKKKWEQKVPS